MQDADQDSKIAGKYTTMIGRIFTTEEVELPDKPGLDFT